MSATLAEPIIWYNEDSASPLTVSKPAAFASGQILVAVIHQHAPSGHVTDLTAPTGWTQVTGDMTGTNSQGRVFYHVYNGSEPSTWDFPYYTNADVCLALLRISGADTTPTISLTTANSTSVGSTFDSPTITPAGTDDLLICTIGDICDGNTFAVTAPSGMAAATSTQIAGGFMALAGSTLGLSSGSATGAKTWTSISPTGHDGGSFSIVVKSAAAGAAPAFVAGTGPSRRRLLSSARFARGQRIATPPPAAPPVPPTTVGIHEPRRLRGLLARRAESFQPVPAQVILPTPPITQRATSCRRKLVGLRRGRVVGPVPPQVAVLAPAWPPAPARDRVKVLLIRRRPIPSLPPPQAAPPPTGRPRRPTLIRWWRLRAQAGPAIRHGGHPATTTRARVKLGRLARGRIVVVTPPQVVFAPPPMIPTALRGRVKPALLVHHLRSTPVPLTAAACDCQVHRPTSGLTARPGTTTIARPFAGTTTRPCSCQ